MAGHSNGHAAIKFLRSRKLLSIVLMSPTIFLIALAMSLEAKEFLNGKTVCGDPRVDLARYMTYPTFFLVLPMMFGSRLYDRILRDRIVSDGGGSDQILHAVLRYLGALWLSFFFLLPLLLSCGRLVTPWFYIHNFEGVPMRRFFYIFGLPLAVIVELLLFEVGRRYVFGSEWDSERLSARSSTATEEKWRFRDLVLPYNLGAISFWLLSSLIAVSVSELFGVTFQNPVTAKLSSFVHSTIPLVLILLVTGIVTHKLQTWQKPVRAIALGIAVVITQLYAPVHFLDDFGVVCQFARFRVIL